jgi:hypothetical protein
MSKKDVELGRTYKDIVTGFKGVATSITTYIAGCESVGLTPKINDKGETGTICEFDITRLKLIGNIKKIEIPIIKTGGDPPKKGKGTRR